MLPDLRQPAADLLAAFGEQHVIAFFLVLARLSPLFLFAPLFSSKLIPARARGILAVAIAVGLSPVVAKGGLLPVDVIAVFGLIAKELMVGAVYAFVIGALFAALSVAGNFLDFMIGFSFGGSVDPLNGVQSSVLTTIYSLIGVVIFLVIGGDAWMLRGFAHSYELVELSQLPRFDLTLDAVLSAFTGIFGSAIQIAGPVMLALVLTDAAFGLISRVMPQLNVFQVGFPAKVFVGLLLVGATLPFVAGWLSDRLAEDVATALRALKVG